MRFVGEEIINKYYNITKIDKLDFPAYLSIRTESDRVTVHERPECLLLSAIITTLIVFILFYQQVKHSYWE